MKQLLAISIISLFCACTSKKPDWQISDFIHQSPQENVYKTFQYSSDTTTTIVYLKQDEIKINDSIYEFATLWLNRDSLPINSGVERYTSTNRIQLVKQSYFEQIGPDRVVEIKGEIDGEQYLPITREPQTFIIHFNSLVDTLVRLNITATVHAQFKESSEEIITTGKILEVQSQEITAIDFLDNRRDTVIRSTSKKIYELGKGLIYFEVVGSQEKAIYTLID